MVTEEKVDENVVTSVSNVIIEATRKITESSHNATDDKPPSDEEIHAIANAIIQEYHIRNQSTSVGITNLNVTDNSVSNCNNCTICEPEQGLKDTPWYWYLTIGLLLILVTLGVALATWIFLDERKTRVVAKKKAERRASLAGTLDR